MNFESQLDGTDLRVQAYLEERGPALIAALTAKADFLMTLLQSEIQGKLEGPVLHVRSGNLIGSVHTIPASADGLQITAGVAAGGPSAAYATAHEYGVDHAWDIVAKNARALAFVLNGQQVFAKRVTHPPLPERSFMRSSLQEMAPDIVAGLEQAVEGAL